MRGSGQEDRNVIAIDVTLNSGDNMRGHIVAGITGKLVETLNKPDPFIEFIKPSGETMLLAKSSIAMIAPVKVVKVDQLSKRMQETGLPNPYVVLGIPQNANQMEVQNAYHSLARRYHPDHFSGREIPPEVLQYVSAMFQRITAAYNELKTSAKPANAGAANHPGAPPPPGATAPQGSTPPQGAGAAGHPGATPPGAGAQSQQRPPQPARPTFNAA